MSKSMFVHTFVYELCLCMFSPQGHIEAQAHTCSEDDMAWTCVISEKNEKGKGCVCVGASD